MTAGSSAARCWLGVSTEAWETLRHRQKTAPVDVRGLALALGVEVHEEALGATVAGRLARVGKAEAGKGSWHIVVNSAHGPIRRRFTLAHELAHYLLHRGRIPYLVEDNTFYRSHLDFNLEAEANRAAADILMPFDLIERLMADGCTDIATLASMLQVGADGLRTRLGIPVVD